VRYTEIQLFDLRFCITSPLSGLFEVPIVLYKDFTGEFSTYCILVGGTLQLQTTLL